MQYWRSAKNNSEFNLTVNKLWNMFVSFQANSRLVTILSGLLSQRSNILLIQLHEQINYKLLKRIMPATHPSCLLAYVYLRLVGGQ